MNKNSLPKIVITSGEPAGIGPDLCLQLSLHNLAAKILVLGNDQLFQQRAKQLSSNVDIKTFSSIDEEIATHQPGQLNLVSLPLAQTVEAGILNPDNSPYVLQQIETAINACQKNLFHAMVTGPVHKGVINQAGVSFTGHTEFLAEKTGSKLPVMMLQTEGLRVALATTHLPLKLVPGALNIELLIDIISILHRDLVNRYGIEKPAILVCGLNPHAGESGYLGDEEIHIIEPAITKCRDQGINAIGPLSADTIFNEQNLKKADVFLAMYHDQGLPVIKFKGFGETVNVTLGLPIIRTSVDHGTALDLAGSGQADATSFIEAIKAACQLQAN